MPRTTRSALLAAGLLVCMLTACGKKGPPLAPLLRLPAPVGDFSARRLGSAVYIRFVVPGKNQDNSTPADVARVDVYGMTGAPPTDEDFVKYGTLVASAAVRRPPTPEEEDRARQKEDRAKRNPGDAGGQPQAAPAERKAAEPEPGFDQGAAVTIVETLTAASTRPVTLPSRGRAKAVPVVKPAATLPVASFDDMPTRFYVAVGVNHKGHRGAFSTRVAVPVGPLQPAPSGLKLTYTEAAISLTWTPPAGAPVLPVGTLEPEATEETTESGYVARKAIPGQGGPTWLYDVFEVAPKATAAAGSSKPAGAPEMPRVEEPLPLNQQPLATITFTDPNLEFGVERCYQVRTINVFAKVRQESEPSEVACVTPRDVFPPAAPRQLIVVASPGMMSLNWEPNSESDLAGYLVLRGEAGGPLQPLMRAPIRETAYDDKTATPGVRYAYVVVAVDRAGNASPQSNRVEETAR